MTTTGSAELTLIQLSDTHVLPEGQLMYDQVDTLAVLERVAATVAASAGPVAALLLTGDLADDGSHAAYRRLRAVVEPLADRLGAAVVYAMGNHDERVAFRAELLGLAASADPCDQVHTVGGLRVVVLDSTTPGRHDGRLTDDQLRWLGDVLGDPAPLGTLLVVHHPPLPSPVPTVHLLRLAAVHRLAEVVAGSDVRLVVTGHAHYAGCGAIGGVPVWVSPALAYHIDAMPPRGRQWGRGGGGFTRIDLIDGQLVATAVPLGPDPLGQFDVVVDDDEAEMVELIKSLTPEVR